MGLEIKFKSIAVRWFLNIFMIIVAVVTVAVTAAAFLYNSLYTERVKTLAEDYSYTFDALKNYTSDTFEDAAIELAGGYTYKNKVEVQVMDTAGRVLVSTTGFQPNYDVSGEYNAALSGGGTYHFEGKNLDGERVMATTYIIKDAENKVIGAYRWIVSLEGVHSKTVSFAFLAIGIGIGALGFTAISGIFFINSIVRPIRKVSNMARKMAMGDFQSRIEIERNDEIGELCDTINHMASELGQAETIKNDFISSVSHELRTPLTAIRGWGETAKMSVDNDPELVNRGLDVVLSEADRLSSLVEELLDFSRMQTGRLTVNTRPTDISVLLKAASDMYTELARQQGIELSYTVPAKESTVLGDPDRLKQVFINIIDNAVKYSQKGGLVLIDQTEEEGCVRIAVKDTGVGIPAQDLDHVKEKFFKSNKTVRGSGIGLAVADEIIKQHQGLLFVESTEGAGTTVTIVLPLYVKEVLLEGAEGEDSVPIDSIIGAGDEIVTNTIEDIED